MSQTSECSLIVQGGYKENGKKGAGEELAQRG